ncbi:MAG: 4-alpha-glucanotransferase, partial [Candidatus Omnitrophota bacterium]
MYCAKGQRWGVPTYNWEKIAGDGYRYLKEKFAFAENFYDILRVDHVVGLFRIWSIPYNEPLEAGGLNGFFDPKDEAVWKERGKTILSEMVNAASILLVAEDLGMIPAACPETLAELKIPGNNVQRWTKDWAVTHDFLKPKRYRKLSVAMLSTHDTTNWPAWWENEAGTVDEALFIRKAIDRKIDYPGVKERLFDPALSRHGRLRWLKEVDSVDKFVGILGKPKEELKDFIELYQDTYLEKEKLWKDLGLAGAMRKKSDADIIKAALSITFNSRAVFCIELLNDYLFLADMLKGDPYNYRINRPGTVSINNWSMVMPVSLEALLKHKKVCQEIKDMISSSDRI